MIFTDDNVTLPYVIGELGPNWCVSASRDENEQRLYKLIRAAEVAGANAIKLQLKSFAPGGYYERKNLAAKPPWPACPFDTMGAYYRAREPDVALLSGVAQYCAQHGMDWSASPWDLPSVDLLGHFDVPWVKVASASITDLPLLTAVRRLHRPVVLSTGMSTLEEVDRAMEALGGHVVCLLHCVSTYPCRVPETDLRVMGTLAERYSVQAGWSGHERERDSAISVAAAALGAAVIERHLTADVDEAWGPDHASSLDPGAFFAMVRDCRAARAVALMGDGLKRVAASEEAARARLRG